MTALNEAVSMKIERPLLQVEFLPEDLIPTSHLMYQMFFGHRIKGWSKWTGLNIISIEEWLDSQSLLIPAISLTIDKEKVHREWDKDYEGYKDYLSPSQSTIDWHKKRGLISYPAQEEFTRWGKAVSQFAGLYDGDKVFYYSRYQVHAYRLLEEGLTNQLLYLLPSLTGYKERDAGNTDWHKHHLHELIDRLRKKMYDFSRFITIHNDIKIQKMAELKALAKLKADNPLERDCVRGDIKKDIPRILKKYELTADSLVSYLYTWGQELLAYGRYGKILNTRDTDFIKGISDQQFAESDEAYEMIDRLCWYSVLVQEFHGKDVFTMFPDPDYDFKRNKEFKIPKFQTAREFALQATDKICKYCKKEYKIYVKSKKQFNCGAKECKRAYVNEYKRLKRRQAHKTAS